LLKIQLYNQKPLSKKKERGKTFPRALAMCRSSNIMMPSWWLLYFYTIYITLVLILIYYRWSQKYHDIRSYTRTYLHHMRLPLTKLNCMCVPIQHVQPYQYIIINAYTYATVNIRRMYKYLGYLATATLRLYYTLIQMNNTI